jgi:hypothetical protein
MIVLYPQLVTGAPLMKMDNLIKKRFAELDSKADEVQKTSHQIEYGYSVDSAKLKEWMTSVLSLLQRVLGEDSIHYRNFHEQYRNFRQYSEFFHDCRGIFNAAREDYEGGYLFNIRGLVQAEVLDDALEQATELLRAGYKDPACVVAGVSLETAVKELCARQGIPHSKLDKMNADLCKAGIYNMGWQKQITAWAERRNKAAHGEWTAYNDADVDDLIKGVTRFIAEYL